MNKEQLQKILDNHKLWLSNNSKGERADLRGAYLRYACLEDANLRGAYLQCANLQYAHLSCANLRGADLRGANLRGADLRGAYLRYACLEDANLRGVNLEDANLQDANLEYAIGNMREVCSIQIEKYAIVYTSDTLFIGCEKYSIEEWKAFTDEELDRMGVGVLEWWKKWKDWLFMTVEMSFKEVIK